MARPSLRNHPKFKRLVHMLGIPQPHALGLLEFLWSVAYESGEPIIGDCVDVELAAGWTGEAGMLCTALMEAGGKGRKGFITLSEDGRYAIHDLWDHAPDYVRSRCRMEEYRKRNRADKTQTKDKENDNVTQPLRNGDASPAPAPAPAPALRKKEASPPPPFDFPSISLRFPFDFPTELDTEDFKNAWADWERHRVEIKKPLRPTSKAGTIAMLSKNGHDPAIAMIRHTIAMGWQGLRAPEQPRAAPGQTAAERRKAEFDAALEAVT